jgi:hypothetical protein
MSAKTLLFLLTAPMVSALETRVVGGKEVDQQPPYFTYLNSYKLDKAKHIMGHSECGSTLIHEDIGKFGIP